MESRTQDSTEKGRTHFLAAICAAVAAFATRSGGKFAIGNSPPFSRPVPAPLFDIVARERPAALTGRRERGVLEL